MTEKIASIESIRAAEDYVRSELSDAVEYENRQPLDETGVWNLHNLVAEVYALGYADGVAAESVRMFGRLDRKWRR